MPSGHRGVNVSAYLQDLNTIPSGEEQVDTFNPDDLDLWTNTQFFDFDMGGEVVHDSTMNEAKEQKQAVAAVEAAAIDPNLREGAGDFDNFFNELKDFANFHYSPTFTNFPAGEPQQPVQAPVAPDVLPAVPPAERPAAQQQPIAAAPIPKHPNSNSAPSPAAATPATSPTASVPRGSKRKASASSPESSGNLEEASRLAAEEDKRRRNTAASARFRVKKKQKEQQLEKTAKEMSERVRGLEQRIQQLELENKWLKGLIVEKNGGKSGEEMMMPPSILAGSKDGVGTIPSIGK